MLTHLSQQPKRIYFNISVLCSLPRRIAWIRQRTFRQCMITAKKTVAIFFFPTDNKQCENIYLLRIEAYDIYQMIFLHRGKKLFK